MVDNIFNLSELVRLERQRAGMNQAELAAALGRDRSWVVQLERGRRYNGNPFETEPLMVMKLAAVLKIDPVDALVASGIDKSQWPDLSHIRSKSANVRTVDITTLSNSQAKLVEQLVKEFKDGNKQNESGK
ncbi:helix-turn-helix domain-containing protein [Corynebacterium aurimucosum]